jgi:hypothetical protein
MVPLKRPVVLVTVCTMVPGSPSVLFQITVVPTGTVKILGLNSLPGALTKASLATCTVGGVGGVAGVVGAAGVVGGVGGVGGVVGVVGAVAAAAADGVAGAGLAQAPRISNTPTSNMPIIRVILILTLPNTLVIGVVYRFKGRFAYDFYRVL